MAGSVCRNGSSATTPQILSYSQIPYLPTAIQPGHGSTQDPKMHRYPSAFLSHQRTYLKLKLLKCSDPIPPDVDPSEIRHLIINSGWRICSSGSLDEALCVLPALPMLEVLRLHYMTWDNVSKSSKTILTSSFSHIVQLELSRFGCDTLQELVEILLSFPRLQSLSLDELEETIESVKPALPGLGVSPPFQHLTSLHISLSYAADFVSWLLKIEPLPPISRLSLGEIADSFPIYPDCEPWQDRGILKHQANALVDCQRHFAASIEHVIYRAIGEQSAPIYPDVLTIHRQLRRCTSPSRSSHFRGRNLVY